MAWGKVVTPQQRVLYFHDLSTNDSFVIDTRQSRGAVYRKVAMSSRGLQNLSELMLEEATGLLFPPTSSPVKPVDVEVAVNTARPSIY